MNGLVLALGLPEIFTIGVSLLIYNVVINLVLFFEFGYGDLYIVGSVMHFRGVD